MKKESTEKFNLEKFINCFKGDRAFASEILQAFIEDYSLRETQLDNAFLNNDFTQIEEAAHSIKGLLKNIGSEDIAVFSKGMEANSNKENIETAREFYQQFKPKIKILLVQLKTFINSNIDC